MKPTQNQIKRYLEWVNGLAAFMCNHIGNQPADPDLVCVRRWLNELTVDGLPRQETCQACYDNFMRSQLGG